MIFKRSMQEAKLHSGYKDTTEIYSFSILNDLIYYESSSSFENLQNKIDNRLYPDLIASLYRKMYENGLTKRKTITDALIACSYFLQTGGFSFLGFIRKDDEMDRKGNKLDFVSSWDFDNNTYKIHKGTMDESEESIKSIFSSQDFSNSYNVFFVAGSQSFEMLDLRINRAAALISSLSNNLLISNDNTKVILSGWNNAKVANSKVQFSNESLAMRNLLIHKLIRYLETELTDEFIVSKIESDINSRDTKENIEELQKKLETFYEEAILQNKTQFNLFIVSSTFHLLQLSDHIKSKEAEMHRRLSSAQIKPNLFLVGSENPNHFFRIYDSHYIKLLMNEIIHRNFAFCRNNK